MVVVQILLGVFATISASIAVALFAFAHPGRENPIDMMFALLMVGLTGIFAMLLLLTFF